MDGMGSLVLTGSGLFTGREMAHINDKRGECGRPVSFSLNWVEVIGRRIEFNVATKARADDFGLFSTSDAPKFNYQTGYPERVVWLDTVSREHWEFEGIKRLMFSLDDMAAYEPYYLVVERPNKEPVRFFMSGPHTAF